MGAYIVFCQMDREEGGAYMRQFMVCVFLVWLNYVRTSSMYGATKERNDKEASKLVARHFNLPNHSKQNVAVCGLSLHLGN